MKLIPSYNLSPGKLFRHANNALHFYPTRPLGFDLEWRVMWQAGAPERRTALVQLCDTRTILLIQVSSMKSANRLS